MALINCPECNKEISENAPTCPNCGARNGKVAKHGSVVVIFGLICAMLCVFTGTYVGLIFAGLMIVFGIIRITTGVNI